MNRSSDCLHTSLLRARYDASVYTVDFCDQLGVCSLARLNLLEGDMLRLLNFDTGTAACATAASSHLHTPAIDFSFRIQRTRNASIPTLFVRACHSRADESIRQVQLCTTRDSGQ